MACIVGLQVSTVSGSVKQIRAAMVVETCDLPARAMVLNMRQFNGSHGCHLCEDPGENSAVNPMLRWWPYNSESTLRTKVALMKDSVKATLNSDIVSSICFKLRGVLWWMGG